ncbi:methylated-DNA--[protein]-cysteine S-methyltransferase [Pseudonocardia sp. GCM10023141]|uniref:methylated-DNA--[protein]-cysteine S-methyltransferase n=1 Tax=Pseudonocardia sp. GCM10023141 TaxID=3252653 RepID=UPI0036D312D7
MSWTTTHPTPIGPVTITATENGVTHLRFRSRRPLSNPDDHMSFQAAWMKTVHGKFELDAYFEGTLTRFTVPVDLNRLDAEHRTVLDAVRAIEYGETTTYGALAKQVGLTADGPRRVGVAMARNPVLILVPCHRVLGANGKLTGYAGGLAAKQALLDLEAAGGQPRRLPHAI